MDVWEVPRSSRPGLDRGLLMDAGPTHARSPADSQPRTGEGPRGWRRFDLLAFARGCRGGRTACRPDGFACESLENAAVARDCLAGAAFYRPGSLSSGVPSQIVIVPSSPAAARSRASGLNATPRTMPGGPRRVKASWPVLVPQSFTPPPPPAETRRLPSGLKTRLVTQPVCPRQVMGSTSPSGLRSEGRGGADKSQIATAKS